MVAIFFFHPECLKPMGEMSGLAMSEESALLSVGRMDQVARTDRRGRRPNAPVPSLSRSQDDAPAPLPSSPLSAKRTATPEPTDAQRAQQIMALARALRTERLHSLLTADERLVLQESLLPPQPCVERYLHSNPRTCLVGYGTLALVVGAAASVALSARPIPTTHENPKIRRVIDRLLGSG